MAVKMTGFKEAAEHLRSYADTLADEGACLADLREAVEPVAQRMRENLSSHRRTGNTEADITVADVPTDEPNVVKVAVGGTAGKKGRGFVGRFLEFGTSKMPAFPWARPAWDAEKGGIVPRLKAALARRAGTAR